eukprot:GFYU01015487.1.p1 GENE.GFYU01015487.1~~GFYU01015487.1.p1  ORF type:complete len:485 (+),score=121.52 GFYU01015487.1:40-1494(+)
MTFTSSQLGPFVLLAVVTIAAASQAVPAKPSQAQLDWQAREIGALVHYNMATYVIDGDPACNADNWGDSGKASHFNPTDLDTDDWVESMVDLGAKEAVLTAKHGCGFLLWPTQTHLPDGRAYEYRVGSNSAAYKGDVLQQFVASCKKHDIGHGFYYSLTNNFYLNVYHTAVQNTTVLPGQERVTQEEFERLAVAQLTELWTNYGNLTEIWFDGGYRSDMKDELSGLLAKLQPNSCAFNGAGVSSNPLRWIGTEAGKAPYPTWSTGTTADGGDPNSPVWAPAECDTTLQNGDHWFYTGPDTAIRSLKELQDVYHGTVGRNGFLMLDFAVSPTGKLAPSHKQRYKEFGDWVRECYGHPIKATSGSSSVLTLSLEQHDSFDRVVVQEDQKDGQVIREYKLEYTADATGSSEWKLLATGSSVGNKRIELLPSAITDARVVRLTITETRDASSTPTIKNFSVHNCSADEVELSADQSFPWTFPSSIGIE